ncbi:MAG: hypothetical protein ABJP70_09815 [Erythrobacter sp.]
MKQAIFAALALLASAGLAQDKTAVDELGIAQPGRHTLETEAMSADFPCAPEPTTKGPTSGQGGLQCTQGGLTFMLATAPTVASDDGGQAFGSFEDNLKGAREDTQTSRVLEGEINGLRMFDAWTDSDVRVGRARMVELAEDVIGIVLVLETKDGKIALNSAERELAAEKAEAFIDSLELLAK